MSGYFIEPDGHDELTLWRATSDARGPESIVRRCDVGETAWGLLVAQVESLSAPVPAVPLTDAERARNDRRQLWWLEHFLTTEGTTNTHRQRGVQLYRYLCETCPHDWEDVSGLFDVPDGTLQCRACAHVVLPDDPERDALLAARAAAQPPAADRDALGKVWAVIDEYFDPDPEDVWRLHRDLRAALAAHPAPDAVPADRVRALAEEWDSYEWTAVCRTTRQVGEADGRERAAREHARALRALLADHQPATDAEGNPHA